MNPPGPFISLLTAPSRGAVAVLRVWGAGALDAADHAFRPHRGRPLKQTRPGRLRVGRVGFGAGDEVVAVRLEDGEVEFQGHGGPAAVALVTDALESLGARCLPASEWLKRRPLSRLRIQALEDLSGTETVLASEILLEQSQGALDCEFQRILTLLGNPENVPEALRDLDTLLARGRIGRRLRSGWTVALAGRPNVGKSRLLNALAGFERAIVDPTPGTTRDVISVRSALGGWPVELADTAGLRDSDDPIEAAGVASARAVQAGADLVLLVLDGSQPLTEADERMLEAFPSALRLANKSDLPPAWPAESKAALQISAQRGDGLDDLVRSLSHRLVPDPPPAGSAVPFRETHTRLLERVRQRLIERRLQRARELLRWISDSPR